MIRMIIPITLLLTTIALSAEIYKCTDDDGKLTFSDSKCSGNPESVDIKVTSSGLQMGAHGDWSGTINANRDRDINRAISRHHRNIQALQKARNKHLASLRNRKKRTSNNLAGATLDQALSGEMQAVAADYNMRIQLERDSVQELRRND